jgi:hypothetical protein
MIQVDGSAGSWEGAVGLGDVLGVGVDAGDGDVLGSGSAGPQAVSRRTMPTPTATPLAHRIEAG